MASGILRMTDGARRVADLIGDPPREVPRRPLWGLIGFLAFQTLPEPLRRLYGVPDGPARRALMRASLLGLRVARPLAPPKIRFVAPAVMAGWRLEGRYRLPGRGRRPLARRGDDCAILISRWQSDPRAPRTSCCGSTRAGRAPPDRGRRRGPLGLRRASGRRWPGWSRSAAATSAS
jgi:hypothetical protein